MIRYEVLNRIKLVRGRWEFQGQIIAGRKIIPIKGNVPNLETNGMIKKAIIKEMEKALEEKSPKPTAPVIKILSQNNIFKEELTVPREQIRWK